MTKKQNRASGFGTRSLSLALAVLMVLSVFAVMLTSTSLSAGAEISYWFVSGSMNGWTTSATSANKINSGSGGSVTIPVNASGINFKMIAEENGAKWCGVSGSGENVTIGNNTKTELVWNGGQNMHLDLPANTTSVTFTLTVENGKNYVTATPNTSGGGGEGGDTSQMTYSAPVNKSNSANTASNLFWANATYFDYLSDEELSNTQWLKPVQAGTKDFNGAIDEWYPFYKFNREVVKAQADAHSDWSEPLYFGNFTDTNDAYKESSHHQGGTDSYGYREATNSYNVTRFVHIANNSDKSWNNSIPHVYDMNTSYQGLVNSELSDTGELLLPNGQPAPYFNASESGPLSGHAKVVNSSFPFKVTDVAGKDYKRYTFNSKNATDNVYFTWASDGSATYPTGVNYGAGTTYGVQDGLSRFMYSTASGYGIFPFNNASNNYKGTKTNANENLNYGFGIKTQVKFRVPKPDESKGVNTAADPIYFDFTGDDDLWMYITDENGNSQLVLDMGGDHKESHGRVNFNTLKATVDKVGTSGSSATKSFTFDYSKTYTMTVFYMERGLIESNCKMEFTMTPLGNNFIVTEEIKDTDVNDSLKDIVKELSSFGFTPYKNNSELDDQDYGDFELGNGDSIQIPDSSLEINSKVKVEQYAPTTSYLVYDTSWKYYDNTSNPRKLIGEGTGVTSNGITTITNENTIINESGDTYDFAELQVDYVNTPQVGSFSVSKQIDDENTDADYSDESFPMTIYLQFDSSEPYQAYTLTDTNGNVAQGGRITLKDGETVSFDGVPIGTHYYVVEDPDDNYTVEYSSTKSNPAIVGTNGSLIVTNTPVNPDAVDGTVSGEKTLDGKPYTGDMFLFCLEGIERFAGEDDSYIDTSATYTDTNTVEDGKFTFDKLTFNKPGIYRYHVYEDMDYLTTFGTDFYSFGNEFLVSFTVTEENHELKVDGPTYYAYSKYEDMVAQPGASGPPQEHTMTPDDFNADKKVAKIEFGNGLNVGSIRIKKEDPSGASLDGVVFDVYKIDATIQGYIDTYAEADHSKDAALYDAIKAYSGKVTAGGGMTGEGPSGEHGVAEIYDLPIYKDGFVKTTQSGGTDGITVQSADFSGYQGYVMVESYSDDPSYSINKTVNVFSFPINGQYDFTYRYFNTLLKSPSTAGPGMTIFKIIGLALAGLSVLALGGYVLYTKKYAKRKTAKHYEK